MKATVTFDIDFKIIKKGFALAEEDVPSDEDLQEKFKEPVSIDLSDLGEDGKQAELAFAMLAISKVYDI